MMMVTGDLDKNNCGSEKKTKGEKKTGMRGGGDSTDRSFKPHNHTLDRVLYRLITR